jgi:GntR family transcriptional regulator
MDQKRDFYRKFGSQAVPGMTKYALLRDALLKAIESGFFAPGEKLPAENDLAGMTPFGLGTVQRALRELAEEGIIKRSQGHGSFVAGPAKPMHKPWHCRFLDDEGTGFLPIFPKILSVRRIGDYGPWSAFLDQQGENVIRIDRRISINHEFKIYSKFFANADKFGDVLEKPISELEAANLKLLLNQKFNLPITVLTQNLRFLRFPAEVCKAIDVKPATLGLHLEAVASAGKTVHLYYQQWYIPPNARALRIVENSAIDVNYG